MLQKRVFVILYIILLMAILNACFPLQPAPATTQTINTPTSFQTALPSKTTVPSITPTYTVTPTPSLYSTLSPDTYLVYSTVYTESSGNLYYQIEVISLDGKYQGSFIKENLLFERDLPKGDISPNGKFLAFTKRILPDTQETIVLFDLVENRFVEFQNPEKHHDCQMANWSPDGKSIIASCKTDLVADIYIISFENGTFHRVTNCLPIESNCQHPSWSPNDKWIVYSRNVTRPGSSEYWGPYLINTSCLDDTLACMEMQVGSFNARPPYAWSPDGMCLVSQRGDTDINDNHIRIFALENGYPVEKQDIEIKASARDISWSPDGKWIAYSTFAGDIYLVSPDGKDSVFLRQTKHAELFGWLTIPEMEK